MKEQELPRIEARQRSLGVGAAHDQRHLGQAAAAAMSGAGEDQPPDHVRVQQGDHFRDPPPEREADQLVTELLRGRSLLGVSGHRCKNDVLEIERESVDEVMRVC